MDIKTGEVEISAGDGVDTEALLRLVQKEIQQKSLTIKINPNLKGFTVSKDGGSHFDIEGAIREALCSLLTPEVALLITAS